MDNVNSVVITTSVKHQSIAQYQLQFSLTEQQLYAANKIVKAIKMQENLLLDAVTGAGKTEMIFKGIQYARQHGLNVAVVSPRVDVVIEVSMRLVDAFKYEDIDIIYEGHPQQFNGHLVVATVQQLLRFKEHFDVIFIDEVDAFPLAMDPILMKALALASCQKYSHIYMTATPPKQLLKTIPARNQIKLPSRYHRHLLPVPTFKYLKLYTHKIHPTLLQILKQQIQNKRITLVFVNNIVDMKKLYQLYRSYIEELNYVYSDDNKRYEKIADLRAGKYKVIFTTTILERGFTMAHIDVIVLQSHLFLTSALIQIAGRVGRKLHACDGLVLFCHQGVSWSMIAARRKIKHMNHLAVKKGWSDA
ncbi:DEAD/DEAH box helicase family protein [Staphylococcus kloosii]|uniref:DEAD/DEAH box helicase family protein n=1 Tax=Staphylococcus kloosii TaxID=29384 RepID=UPI0028A48335|nr:DEAD/DEAH box helicase family protein [Staphylococcus kloosii]MDT3958363.1 DEAD/DEAH box helicase family protein [Staphylococcus kloosii]